VEAKISSLGTQLVFIQTKFDVSILRHMAKFTGIMCSEMWGFVSTPVFKRNSPSRCPLYIIIISALHHIYIYACVQLIVIYVISLGYKKKHISCYNDCAFILVLVVDTNNVYLPKCSNKTVDLC
jgi:hypothetical protein